MPVVLQSEVAQMTAPLTHASPLVPRPRNAPRPCQARILVSRGLHAAHGGGAQGAAGVRPGAAAGRVRPQFYQHSRWVGALIVPLEPW